MQLTSLISIREVSRVCVISKLKNIKQVAANVVGGVKVKAKCVL